MNFRSIAGLFLVGIAVLIYKLSPESFGVHITSFLSSSFFCVGVFLYLYKNHPLKRIGLLLMGGGPFLCLYLAKNIISSEMIFLLFAVIVGFGYYLFRGNEKKP